MSHDELRNKEQLKTKFHDQIIKHQISFALSQKYVKKEIPIVGKMTSGELCLQNFDNMVVPAKDKIQTMFVSADICFSVISTTKLSHQDGSSEALLD